MERKALEVMYSKKILVRLLESLIQDRLRPRSELASFSQIGEPEGMRQRVVQLLGPA